MDLNLILGVTKEELGEFPDYKDSEDKPESKEEGTVVPDCSQNSLHTSQEHSENSIEEAVQEAHSSVPTQLSIRRAKTSTLSGERKGPFRRRGPQVHETHRNREGRHVRHREWQRIKGSKRRQRGTPRGPQETPNRPHRTLAITGGRTNGHRRQGNLHSEEPAYRRTRRQRSNGLDPDSSDSWEEDGTPKTRSPKYYTHKKRKMRWAIKRISPPPPIFKGEPEERPEAHILRTLDWFDAIGIVTDKEMLRNFWHTLDGNAREWFADLWDKERRTLTWEDLTNSFSRYFSTQGQSLTHLHNAWKSSTFDPEAMDIEEFIRDVQECVDLNSGMMNAA